MLRIRLAHDAAFAAGLALLLGLLAASVVGATHDAGEQAPIQIQVQALGDAFVSTPQQGTLNLRGNPGRDAIAQLRFTLPPADPENSRWVLWLARDPLDAVWLQGHDASGVAWRSPSYDFFHPGADEAVLPAGFVFPLPASWQGEIEMELHVRGSMPITLHPRLMREADAARMTHVAVALNAGAYAGLFMLALIVLVLYAVARERSFITAFSCATVALLFLAAANGHLFQLPGFSLLAAWHSQAIWTLLLLFSASLLQLLLRYANLREGAPSVVRWIEWYSFVLVGLSAACLLDLPVLRTWMQMLAVWGWIGVGVAALVVLVDAIRRRLAMAWAILALTLVAISTGVANQAMARGWLPEDLAWNFYGYQIALVAGLALLSLSLLTRIGEYRNERDRDHLARVDSERRMERESARAALAVALQTQLRSLPAADIEWTAGRLLLDHLLPQMVVESAAVVAHGYHGHDVLVVEPARHQQALADDIAARNLSLKRLAMGTVALQQPHFAGTEMLQPLPIHAPGWGLLLLQRNGNDGFSTEEMALAGEFVRLATMHIDEALTALQLRRSAELDALTGTYNRRSIDRWLARAFMDAQRKQEALSLLFIDIDHFKSINDRLGHAGGDQCLRKIAAALRDALEADDLLGRYGGEEFVALLPGRAGADARAMGERLRTAVERCEIVYEGRIERATVSIGVATRLERESTPAAAIARADKALYAAKRGGRNCVHVAPAVFS